MGGLAASKVFLGRLEPDSTWASCVEFPHRPPWQEYQNRFTIFQTSSLKIAGFSPGAEGRHLGCCSHGGGSLNPSSGVPQIGVPGASPQGGSTCLVAVPVLRDPAAGAERDHAGRRADRSLSPGKEDDFEVDIKSWRKINVFRFIYRLLRNSTGSRTPWRINAWGPVPGHCCRHGNCISPDVPCLDGDIGAHR